jgi:hypothetical protein
MLKITNYEAPQQATFCILLLRRLSLVQIFSSAQFLSTLDHFINLTGSSIRMVCGCQKISGNMEIITQQTQPWSVS